MADISKINIEGTEYSIKDETARNSIPTKTSELTNDSGFVTKADIPTDESYELLGETPLTLTDASNIKLVADGETSFEMTTPTVWKFENEDLIFSNCSLSTEKGYFELISGENTTAWHYSWVSFVISGLEIGKTYTLICDTNGLAHDFTNLIQHPVVSIWTGTNTSGTSLVGGYEFKHKGNFEFTATDENLYVRWFPSRKGDTLVGWVSHFNNLYINRADTSEELTEIYSNMGTFTDVATFTAIPEGTTITTDPTAEVYIKAPTDKTLTESDVPADAKVTGEEIKKTRGYLPLYEKTIVNFGDSIFGNAQPPNDISTFLAEKTGATVYNCGFGGCRMSEHVDNWDAFSMYRLADAISSGDYTLQETAVVATDDSGELILPERFTTSLERLKGIDFSNTDIITIAYGSNDFSGYGKDLDNEENLYDTNAFGGALRYSIEKLLTAYPNLKIFVLSIAYRFWTDADNNYAFIDDTNNHANKYGKYTADYNAKLKEIAEEYNLPYVDDYNIGIGKFNRYQYFNATDGAHHKEAGRRLIAEHLASALTTGHSNGANNVPTKTSELENDKGFITKANVPIDRIESTETSAQILPNIDYSFGECEALTLTFTEGDSTKRNEYLFSFISGETATVLTLPDTVVWVNELTVEANKRYEISIVDNIALWCATDYTAEVSE